MLGKKTICYSVICMCIIAILSSSIQACEPKEIDYEKDKNKEEIKESYQNPKSDVSNKGLSNNFFEMFLDRYPLFDQIIQLLLEYLYSWLSNMRMS